MRTECLCISVLRVASGPRVKLAICKSALTPPSGSLLYWPFLGGGPGVSFTLCCFVVYSTRRYVICRSVCHFVLVFFSPFSIAITSLGEERANLSAFRTFVRCVLVWICRFPLWVWEGLRFVIVAGPGLYSYLFLSNLLSAWSCGSGRAHRNQNVSFRLLQHFSNFLLSSPPRCSISVYVWFLCSRKCCTDELETLLADKTNKG